MKFCQPHWDALKDKVKEKGMWSLVSDGPDKAVEFIINPGPQTFEPLMSCHNMIVTNALQAGGLYLMQGDYCPLCEAEKNHPEPGNAERWIKHATDAALDYCTRHKLLTQN